jgi:hypothetical protein
MWPYIVNMLKIVNNLFDMKAIIVAILLVAIINAQSP